MKKKKSQMAGQILMYVLAIIVFSLTLIYGYRAVKYFSDRGTEISYMQLENDITSEIEKVKGDSMGTVKKKILQIPGNYREVCFVNSFPNFPNSITTAYDIINDHIGQNETNAEDANMFLAPPGDVSFDIGDIEVPTGAQCIDVQGGKITLRLESEGDHVKVSGW